MSKTYEALNPETIFGDLQGRIIWSNDSILLTDEIVSITNSNCEMPFDNISGQFVSEPPYFCFKVDLEMVEYDTSNYIPEKSNNGGCYAFADCRVIRIIEEGY